MNFFKDELLENEQKLLKRITFILRMTCKELDNDLFLQMGIKSLNIFSLKYVLTKPKGEGWSYLIKFVFDNLEEIGIKNINFILPVIHDWNNKNNNGETTKCSSLIALQFYQWTIEEDVYWSRDDSKKELFQAIINGSSEIKYELENIFNEILENKWKNHGEPYNDLIKFVLTKIEAIPIVKNLPKHILELANLFWTYTPKKDDRLYRSRIEVEQHFGLESNHSDYHPASAYQTPIYWLLQSNPKETINFILEFTNKSIEKYVISKFDHSVKVVNVSIDKNTNQEQYISHCLWNMYRGTSSPISPYLLQSIHMALEKYFLEIGKDIESETLESWLIYLLKHSKSASISSVVSSIVLAYPDKTFNVAQILFKTREFFIQDTARLISDQGAESLYSIGKSWGSNHNSFFDEERISTCKDKHRNSTLENLFLNYQFFKSKDVSDEEVNKRQENLWSILDNYYAKLSEETTQSESNKTWRIYLARMDKRKMTPTVEKTEEGTIINFNPELESDLKEFSEASISKNSESLIYTPLKLWAEYKFKNDKKAEKYTQYNKNPENAIKDVQKIINKLNKNVDDDENNFILFNRSTPIFVCSVLIRDYFQDLDTDTKEFCKKIILEIATFSLNPSYQYQISDGVQQAFSVMPILFNSFADKKEDIKLILLLGLFRTDHVGGILEHENFNIFPMLAINDLWEKHFDDAQSLLFGYIFLKPLYDELILKIRQENYDKGVYSYQCNSLERLYEENKDIFLEIIENKIEFDSLDFNKLDFFSLKTVFRLIPSKTQDKNHKEIVLSIVSKFANTLLSSNNDDNIDYTIKHDFMQKYAYFVLHLPQNEIQKYLDPFIVKFNKSEHIADLLKEFIHAEDNLNTYDNFWFIWNSFKEKIFEICKDGDEYSYVDKIIKSYLFAEIRWKETAKDWRSFKEQNKRFFRDISENIGHCPSTLYSFSKLLNDIGTPYLEDGINWLSTILDTNKNYIDKKLETNTIYYIEHYIKRYIYRNRDRIRTTKILKGKVLIVLNF